MPCRRARTVAGGAIGREALDAAAVASGAGIKPGEALYREALDAADVPRPPPRRVAAESGCETATPVARAVCLGFCDREDQFPIPIQGPNDSRARWLARARPRPTCRSPTL
jgi:hypothetical protein